MKEYGEFLSAKDCENLLTDYCKIMENVRSIVFSNEMVEAVTGNWRSVNDYLVRTARGILEEFGVSNTEGIYSVDENFNYIGESVRCYVKLEENVNLFFLNENDSTKRRFSIENDAEVSYSEEELKSKGLNKYVFLLSELNALHTKLCLCVCRYGSKKLLR